MQPRIPEKNKKVGICYAVTDDGLELPVIDVTHPAFAIQLGKDELDKLLPDYLKEIKSRERAPAFIQNIVLWFMQRNSVLMRGIAASEGGFLSGMNTYIMKVGPDNLNDGYISKIDRMIAASMPTLSMRLRFQDIVRMLADGLGPVLDARAKVPLHLLNIGGGPAMDSLNSLIVLQKESPKLLGSRGIFIHSLDLDDSGPAFGACALTSLMAEGCPLHGLNIQFEHIKYDWSQTAGLRELLETLAGKDVVVGASSEGALFEYGTDDEIVSNLQALNELTLADVLVSGTVSRADAIGRQMNGSSKAALILRGMDAFKELALRAGWKVDQVIDRLMSHDVLLKKI